MTFSDFLRILWRRKFLVIAVTVAVIAVAYGVIQEVTPQYESSTTLLLTPKKLNSATGPFLVSALTNIMPQYAVAAELPATRDLARTKLGKPLAQTTISSFPDQGIMKVTGRSPSPRLAQGSAQALTDA